MMLPHVKVTEVVGQLAWGNGSWIDCDDVNDNVSLPMLAPEEARRHAVYDEGSGVETGPRGHFKITVEFTPEVKP